MHEYCIEESLKKTVSNKVKRTFLRWKVGHILAGIFIVAWAIIIYSVCQRKSMIGPDVFPAIVAASIVPAILVIFSLIIARGGGSDIVSARLAERVYLKKDSIVYSYVPRFKEVDPSSLIEDEMQWPQIHEIVHEKKRCRYRINGIMKTTKQSISGTSSSTTLTETGTIILYEYFTDMSELVALLQKNSGKMIKEEN